MYMYHRFTVSGFSCHSGKLLDVGEEFPPPKVWRGRKDYWRGGEVAAEVDLFLNLILEKGFNLIPALEEFNLI